MEVLVEDFRRTDGVHSELKLVMHFLLIQSHTLLQIDVGYVLGLALLGGEALAGAQPRD